MRAEPGSAGYDKAPQRAGVSSLLSAVLRTSFDPDESDGGVTLNVPHIMYHAPNVSDAETPREKRKNGCRARAADV